ncbi:MAG: heme-copper oxidase subunit III [Verrucomicrobia bacterium]|jgi:cytochrome o ubiquinol oxidase subunit 3|nr:heme-copper oxidase subunit III [Verrucomicrobiota bacterium]
MSSHAATATIDHHHDPTTATGIPNKKLLMWAFLASDCMFFGTLISTHLIYRLHPPAGGLDPKVVFSPELTSFSTFILLMSSLMMALAVTAIQKGNVKSCRWSLLTTIFFGMIFLGCQVYEFNHFVVDKKMTISNSLLGTTFYTLTGTHGCHVAIGVLWLALMYVRSFKPAAGSSQQTWFAHQLLHAVALLAVMLLALKVTLGLVHSLQVSPSLGTGLGHFLRAEFLAMAGMLVALGACAWFARPRGPVDFGVTHAIDVESMGLYWHFVDIVWIVIFTAVYLLEYL